MRGKCWIIAAAALLLAVMCGLPHRPAAAEPLLLAVGDARAGLDAEDTYLTGGRRMIALRTAGEALHAAVAWDAGSRTASIRRGGVRLEFDVGGRTARMNGGSPEHAPAEIRKGRIYVPLRYTAERLGWKLSALGGGLGVRMTDGSEALTGRELEAELAAALDEVRMARRLTAEAGGQPGAGKPGQGNAAAEWNRGDGTTVFLTFDDGPTPVTPDILDVLEQYGARATFFMLGPQIEAHPSAVRRMLKAGDALGLHGVSHRKDAIYRSPDTVVAEMDAANAALRKAAGVETKLVRVPYGSKPYMTDAYRDALAGARYRMWDWNVDSGDSRKGETAARIEEVTIRQLAALRKEGVNPVVLLHDRRHTLEALPAILAYLNENGYAYGVLHKEMAPLNFWKDTR